MRTIAAILVFVLTSLTVVGQKKVDTTGQVAFIYFKNRVTNLIVIPNIDRLHSFKIFRKTTTDADYIQVAEKKKPPLPMRYNITPYGVIWEDKEYSSPDINYRIIAYNKKGDQVCDLKILWEDDSGEAIKKDQ